jgi:protein SCO1/2
MEDIMRTTLRRLLPALASAGAVVVCAPTLADPPMAMDGAAPMGHEHQHRDMNMKNMSMDMSDPGMKAKMEANMRVPVKSSSADYRVPNVMLKDAAGKMVDLRRVLAADEPLMLNFIFTSCTTVCPVMSGIFSQVQNKLGNSVHLVSISIDPEYDTPNRLVAYGKRFHAGSQWTMLTGSLQDTVAVQRAFSAYYGDKMDHVPATFILAKPGDHWVRIDGLASADDLVHEFHQLTTP